MLRPMPKLLWIGAGEIFHEQIAEVRLQAIRRSPMLETPKPACYTQNNRGTLGSALKRSPTLGREA
jgi:hypothetical protein